MNANIEARFELLEARYEHHESRLNEHHSWFKEHDVKLANQDHILKNFNEILESLKNAHCEHIGWARATRWTAAVSYFRWHGDDEASDHLEDKNMDQFCKVRRLLRLRESKTPRGQRMETMNEAPRLGQAQRRPMGIVILEGEGRRQHREEDNDTRLIPPIREAIGPKHERRKSRRRLHKWWGH